MGAPFMTPVLRRWPQWQKEMVRFGWALTVLSLVAASFASSVAFLIAFQGVTYSIGVTIILFPTVSMLNEWFESRRGLAFGILCAAAGLSGIALPFVLAALLDKYGFRTTLRASAVAMAVLTGPCLPLLKGRLPPSHASVHRKTDLSFLKEPLFWCFAANVFFQGLGHFYPTLFLPSYAYSLGYSPTIGALLLALFSLMQVFGQVANGWLSDKYLSVETIAFAFPAISGVATFTLWGFSHSLPLLIIYSLSYGFFGGGYVVIWAKMGQRFGDNPSIGIVTFGIFAFLKGVGNVITGPISAALLLPDTNAHAYGLEKYRWIVSICGVCMFASAIVVVLRYHISRNLLI
ncbi:MAG: hypothetical protein Q9220_007105 [cf. Caloplaca sp. 1 TL-2023]